MINNKLLSAIFNFDSIDLLVDCYSIYLCFDVEKDSECILKVFFFLCEITIISLREAFVRAKIFHFHVTNQRCFTVETILEILNEHYQCD